jgi:hypothetical protein
MADLVASHVVRSNLPKSEKNAILRFMSSAGTRARHYGSHAFSRGAMFARATHKSAPVRTAIGMGAGAILGALHVKLPRGLDINGKAPIDLIGALGFTALAMGARAGGSHGISHHAETLAVATGATFAFRKTVDLASELERRKGRSPGGTVGMKRTATSGAAPAAHHGDEDPLAAFAKTL